MSYQTDCICVQLRRLARGVTEAYDEALAPAGLRLTQFSLLRAVERNEPAAISMLAEELELDRTTLARNLRPLLRAGHIATRAAECDQRITEVRLTAKGRRAVAAALPLWQAAQTRMAREIGAPRVATLRELSRERPMLVRTGSSASWKRVQSIPVSLAPAESPDAVDPLWRR